MKKVLMKKSLLLIGAIVLTFSTFVFANRFVPYNTPSIKDDYCGPVMYYKYCKCAFHSQHCDAVGLDQGGASNHVNAGFATRAAQKKAEIQASCVGDEGIRKGNGCLRCEYPEFRAGQDCKDIEELCDIIPNTTRDVKEQQCACVFGFEMIDDLCVRKKEAKLNIEIIEGTNPMAADGRSKLLLNISLYSEIREKNFDDPVIEIGYSSASKQGKLTYLRTEAPGEFVFEYIAPRLTDEQGVVDMIYVKYMNIEDELKYKTYNITLASPTPAIVQKPGFIKQDILLFFGGPTAKVITMTQGSHDQIPVNGVDITHSDYFTKFTDPNGEAIIESPTEMEAGQEYESPIELILEDSLKKAQKDAFSVYSDLIQKGLISNNTKIREFIVNSTEVLAAEENELESRMIASAIKRLPTSLGIIRQSDKTATDAGVQIAESWTNLAGSVQDMLNAFLKFDEWIEKYKEKMDEITGYTDKTQKLTDALNSKIGPMSSALGSEFETLLQQGGKHMGPDMIKKTMNQLKEEFVDSALEKYRVYLVLKSKELKPDDIDKFLGELKKLLMGDSFVKDSFQGRVKNYYAQEQKKRNDEILTEISGKLKTNNYPDYSATDIGIENARKSYSNFVGGSYKTRHDQQYNVSRYRDVSNLLIEIFEFKGLGDEVAETELIKKASEMFEGVNKALKTFKVAIDGVLVYHRYDAYGLNQKATKRAALRAMDIHMKEYENNGTSLHNDDQKRAFAEQVYAEEIDMLRTVYESDLATTESGQDMLREFTQASVDIDLYNLMLAFQEIMAELEPNDTGIQANLESVQTQQDEAIQTYKKFEKQIDPYTKSSNNPKTGVGNTGGLAIFIVIMFAVWAGLFLIFRKKRVIKIILYIVGGILILFSLLLIIGNSDMPIEDTSGTSDTDPTTSSTTSTIRENKDFGFQIDLGQAAGTIDILETDEFLTEASYVLCLFLQSDYNDMTCGYGKFNAAIIDIHDEESYKTEIENMTGYTLLGQKDGLYATLSHPNGDFSNEIKTLLGDNFYTKIQESFYR